MITKNMALGEVISKYPKTIEIFMKYNLHCAMCHAASFETIEEGAKAHGMTEKEIKKLLEDLNKVTKKDEK